MIALEEFTRNDFQRLIDWIPTEAFLVQWAGAAFSFPLTEQQLEKYLSGTKEKPLRRLIYRVRDTASGKIIGHLELDNIDFIHRSANICRVLVGPEEYRGKGVGQMMMKTALKIGFDKLELHRMDLRVFDFNHAAIAAYEKAGFIKEGLFRDFRRVGGKYWSVYQMSILRHEWKTAPTDRAENQ